MNVSGAAALRCGLVFASIWSASSSGPLAAERNWTSLSEDGVAWHDPANWDDGGVPSATDTAVFGVTGVPTVIIDDPAVIGSIRYLEDADAYETLLFDTLEVTGGIVNEGGELQRFYVGSTLSFTGGTIDGLVRIETMMNGFDTPRIVFSGDASAGSASIFIPDWVGGEIEFTDESTAGQADIVLTGGSAGFHDSSDAGEATIALDGFGATLHFNDEATAGSATITNYNGSVSFNGKSSAGSATITNDPDSTMSRSISFNDESTAGTATIGANGMFGNVSFWDSSTAGAATLTANGASVTFQDNSTAGSATLIAKSGGTIRFNLDASGGDARAVLEGTGRVSISSLSGSGTTLGSIEGTGGTVVLGSKALAVGSNGLSTTFDGVISGTGGSLEKVGTGTLTLTGSAHTYTGLTTISGGRLVVNGSLLNSSGIVIDGGTLGGSGAVRNVSIGPNGRLAPGNSIGTIEVTGPLGFDPTSVYEVEVDATGLSDLTLVDGTATLAGTVHVVGLPGSYVDGTTYTILTADALVDDFDDITTDLAFFTPTLSYDLENVYVTLTRRSIAGSGETANQRATSTAVDSLGFSNPVFDAALGLTTAEVPAALDALSGEIHATLPGLILTDDTVRRAMAGRRDADDELWAIASGAVSHRPGDGNAGAADAASGTLIAGMDTLAGGWQLGGLVHIGTGSTSLPDRGSSATDAGFGAGLYGSTAAGPLQLSFGGDLARHLIETERDVTFTGFSETLTAAYGATAAQGFVELSADLPAGPATLSPFGNLAHAAVWRDAVAETGSDAALTSEASLTVATTTTLGLRATGTVATGDGGAIDLRGLAGWRQTFADTPSTRNAFAAGDSFSVEGTPIAGDALLLEAGLALALSESSTLSLDYGAELGGAGHTHALNATLSGRF